MMHFQQLAETAHYRFPAEQAERERRARNAALSATAVRTRPAKTESRGARWSFVPRLAGALGLF